jgi:hypothetical protein
MENEHLGVPPDYFDTCFELEGEIDALPSSYTVITAYATTGESWTDKKNAAADKRLQAELSTLGVLTWRMTGYSPVTCHAELGWATTLSLDEAIEIGKRYLQHAIYEVDKGTLFVVLCEDKRKVQIGEMSERLHTRHQARFKSKP